jgi:predicted TIM-barrel fold metal-dependent hydrolase
MTSIWASMPRWDGAPSGSLVAVRVERQVASLKARGPSVSPHPTLPTSCACNLTRRGLIATAVAAVAAVATPRHARTQSPPHRIDLHHHFAPPAWIAAVRGRELLQPANANWTPQRSLEDMDRGGVAAAVVSVTNPGLWFGDREATRTVARACNDYGARLMQDHPTRFGLFAALPLPDVDATLREIEYACDTLKADGVHLFTSYGDVWLGNAAFEPVMAELDRRRALVHVHPTAANCCRNLVPDVPSGIMEYGTDTTRAMLGVMFSGTAARHPNIRFIWSHAGGTAPFLAGRIERGAGALKQREERLPQGARHELRKFHYDLAGAAYAPTVAALRQLVPVSQIVFGTDFPPAGGSREQAQAIAALGFSADELRAIERDNALRLLPRLKT